MSESGSLSNESHEAISRAYGYVLFRSTEPTSTPIRSFPNNFSSELSARVLANSCFTTGVLSRMGNSMHPLS